MPRKTSRQERYSATESGEARTNQSRHHPGGGIEGEHARPEPLRVGAADDDVRDGRDRPGAKALDGAPGNEDHHRRRQATDHETGAKEHKAGRIGKGRAADVRAIAGEGDADEAGEQEGTEHPAVELHVAEVVLCRREGCGDGQRLEGDEGDGEHQANSERSEARAHDAVQGAVRATEVDHPA